MNVSGIKCEGGWEGQVTANSGKVLSAAAGCKLRQEKEQNRELHIQIYQRKSKRLYLQPRTKRSGRTIINKRAKSTAVPTCSRTGGATVAARTHWRCPPIRVRQFSSAAETAGNRIYTFVEQTPNFALRQSLHRLSGRVYNA